jgi:putative methyltransferase (TIGR04325 family)
LPPVVALAGREKLKILDFGGGVGIGYMTLLESIPEAASRIQYTVVEIPEVCELGEQIHGKRGGISYISSIPLCTSFDIVHAASSIQYIENWENWVSAITSLKPNFILLSDVFAGEINSFVTLQHYYGSRIPHWFLSLKDLLSAFDACGYQLVMKSSVASRRLNQYDVLPMDNFPEPLRLQESLHLLFKAKVTPA